MVVTVGTGKNKMNIDNAVGFSINNGIATIEKNDFTGVITTEPITAEFNASEWAKLKEGQKNAEEEEHNSNE